MTLYHVRDFLTGTEFNATRDELTDRFGDDVAASILGDDALVDGFELLAVLPPGDDGGQQSLGDIDL